MFNKFSFVWRLFLCDDNSKERITLQLQIESILKFTQRLFHEEIIIQCECETKISPECFQVI